MGAQALQLALAFMAATLLHGEAEALLERRSVFDVSDEIIEAQMTAQQFQEMGLQEGETLLLTPRKARVFVA